MPLNKSLLVKQSRNKIDRKKNCGAIFFRNNSVILDRLEASSWFTIKIDQKADNIQ